MKLALYTTRRHRLHTGMNVKTVFWCLLCAVASAACTYLATDEPKVDVTRVTAQLRSHTDHLSVAPHVLGAAVIQANVFSNERTPVYYHVSDDATAALVRRYVVLHGLRQVIFTRREEARDSTLDMLSVMNGGAVCTPFTATMMWRTMPEMGDRVKGVCLFGMPFLDARYRHYVLLFLDREHTVEEADTVMHDRVEAVKHAMYFSWINQ